MGPLWRLPVKAELEVWLGSLVCPTLRHISSRGVLQVLILMVSETVFLGPFFQEFGNFSPVLVFQGSIRSTSNVQNWYMSLKIFRSGELLF